MQVQYDPNIIGQAAARLYARAAGIVVSWALLVGLCGFALGGFLGGALASPSDRSVGIFGGGLAVGLIGAVVGIVAGRERAFFLRLEAQRMLVLVQIETNTRDREIAGRSSG